MTIAYVFHDQLDFTRASLLYGEALQRFRHSNDTYGIIRTLNSQGALAFDIGDLDTAASLFSECLALARECGDRENMAVAITNLGDGLAAISLCREAMMLFHELGNKLGVAFCLEGIGAGFALANQSERAVKLFGAANALRKSIAALPAGTHAHHIESILQRVRSALPEAVFASAWSEGETMLLKQAMESAMEKSG
jgi:tetratricopeptide (TPR) repeat protein